MSELARMRYKRPHEVDELLKRLRKDPMAIPLGAAFVVLLIVALLSLDQFLAPAPPHQIGLSYGDFKRELKNGHVKAVWTHGSTFDGDLTQVVPETGSKRTGSSFITTIPNTGDPELAALLNDPKIQVNPPRISFIWDFVASASAFSTLSAVLAGFVIVAIVAILTFDPKVDPSQAKPTKHDPLPPLLTAFLTLVLAAFLFAVMAGMHMAAGVDLRTHAEGFLLSWILAIGVVQTCVGITWLMNAYVTPQAVVRTSEWICDCAIVVAAISTSGLLVLPLYEVYGDSLLRDTFAWAITLFIIILSIPVGRRLRRYFGEQWLMNLLTPPALIGVLTAAAFFGALTGVSDATVRDSYGLVFGLLIGSQLVLAAGFALYEACLPNVPKEAR